VILVGLWFGFTDKWIDRLGWVSYGDLLIVMIILYVVLFVLADIAIMFYHRL
jgi:sterol desaturase/sphingolipid hydroxylase (fatty acid hydroxylase superfamily)